MKSRIWTSLIGIVLSLGIAGAAAAQQTKKDEAPSYGPELEGFDYPYDVQHFSFDSERQSLQMAY
ncbi:MAG TPA: alpha/beta hydrolase, partial [Bradyrhizobium sp.]|nr:alpha/beta hydrolase [Bradyrhizobium sp.]